MRNSHIRPPGEQADRHPRRQGALLVGIRGRTAAPQAIAYGAGPERAALSVKRRSVEPPYGLVMPFSVGLQDVGVPGAPRIPLLVFYPTAEPEKSEAFGPFTASVAKGAAPLPGPFPLVLISHGTGGSPLSHRELARYLASLGFVVGVPEHPFDNRNDARGPERIELLAERPRDLRRCADWLFASAPFGSVLVPEAFAVVGHSIGAYSGLALAGGVPRSLPHQSPDRQARRIEVERDGRVKALVLLAPATPWFRQRGSLEAVTAPILMIASYADAAAPYFYMCQVVLDGVGPGHPVDYRLVEGASHYGFLSPWPDALKGTAIPPSLDPPGFDRRAFLDQLYLDLGAFLTRTMAA
jgi:pimeloyl-ACP methyl ester carboxylesterase